MKNVKLETTKLPKVTTWVDLAERLGLLTETILLESQYCIIFRKLVNLALNFE